VRIIDHVCAESEWMSTKKFTPTLPWLHAFSAPECKFHLLLVAENVGSLVGWCRLFPEQCKYFDIGELGIGLKSDYRDKKIGSNLLKLAFNWAKNIGMKRIDLSVHVDNHCAVHLFKKFNFSVVSNVNDRFLMSADLKKDD
jgi:ribosomal protein S18 acetylase RimI-like enzyme